MDRISQSHRSWNMSQIRGKDTKPEVFVRSLLHGLGYRFRLNQKDIPGKPDITLPKYKTAIYVHGCFWHRHEGCKLAYAPKSNLDFWKTKFQRNVERDARVRKALRDTEWKALVVWECELRDRRALTRRLQEALGMSKH
jgi:DNA mismatch endonuclease, patch repair protein